MAMLGTAPAMALAMVLAVINGERDWRSAMTAVTMTTMTVTVAVAMAMAMGMEIVTVTVRLADERRGDK